MEQKIKNLIVYCQGIYNKENGKALYDKYKEDIQSVTPQDVMLIQYEQLKMGMTSKEMLTFVDKLINIFYKALSQYQWKQPKEGTFLFYLMEENKGLLKNLEDFKTVVKKGDILEERQLTIQFLKNTMNYNEHLLKLENILFPYLEKRMERFNGLQIMWSLHDEVRDKIKRLMTVLEHNEIDTKEINAEIGQLYFNLHGLVQKQELILFPAATELLDDKTFEEMHKQSFEYEFPFIERPKQPESMKEEPKSKYNNLKGLFTTETGHLDLEQLTLLLDALPVDLTFVDEKDEVVYFSKPKGRVFPRSAAVIGRNVRNCHPPESVHVVEAILEAFKKKEKDEATFWIQIKGMFLYIQYIALRDSEGNYKGTLEITQEINHLRVLEGEKRLLDW